VAAQTGLRAVDWSRIGIRGLSSALHDVYADAFGAQPDASQLTEGLGAAWAISDGYHKIFACCQYGHATIEATCKLLERVSVDRVESIHLETHKKAWIMDNPDPTTTIAAKFSIQHIAATAAIHNGGDAKAFSSESLQNPAVASLRHKVTTSPYEPLPDWPNDRPTRVIWTLDDGSKLTEEVLSARGGPDLPFTPEEIRAKICSIVDTPYPGMSDITNAILDLDPVTLSRAWPTLWTFWSSGPAPADWPGRYRHMMPAAMWRFWKAVTDRGAIRRCRRGQSPAPAPDFSKPPGSRTVPSG
jgi:2-methylcitrate dehydratase PrpD